VKKNMNNSNVLMQAITESADELVELGDTEALALADELDQAKQIMQKPVNREELGVENSLEEEKPKLKVLPPHLKYSFLEGDVKKTVILSSSLTAEEERRLIDVLKMNQGAIG